MIVHEDTPALRSMVATACRVLAIQGLADGILGHVSARVSESELIVRSRGASERGLRQSTPGDVHRFTLEGEPVDVPDDYAAPNELPIHTELLRARPDFGAVIHAHPRAALLAGLAELEPRPVFGAYNIPALMLALRPIGRFRRPVLVTRAELARELVAAMAETNVCLMLGHGITVAAETVPQATVLAVNFNALLEVTVQLAQMRAWPPELTREDIRELPDLGQAFNDEMVWRALVAELGDS